ncbi:MAG: elongation factor G, partial [bacterium]
GVIDLVSQKAIHYNDEEFGVEYKILEIPEELKELAQEEREKMLDAVSMFDDELLEKLLEGEEISVGEIRRAIRKGCLLNEITPVFCGSAFKNKGVQPLLDGVIDFLPSPLDIPPVIGFDKDGNELIRKCDSNEPFSALVFKTQVDSFAGALSFIRVYSGKLDVGTQLFNSVQRKKERVTKLFKMHANKREDVKSVEAGDIAAVIGFNFSITGDTVCDKKEPVILEQINYPEPVISIAIEPRTKADQTKLDESLSKLDIEDPSLLVSVHPETGQKLISGMGELHLEVIVARLKREFNLNVNIGKPQVAYRETISTKSVAIGIFDKPLLGKETYAEVALSLKPLEAGSGNKILFQLKDEVSEELQNVIRDGINEGFASGVVAGYPILDIEVTVNSVTSQDDSCNPIAFQIAASLGLRKGLQEGNSVLLEPVMAVEVVAPANFTGDVISDLNSRKGKVKSIEEKKGSQIISSTVALSAMFGYLTALRSLSQGRATYSMMFERYEKSN